MNKRFSLVLALALVLFAFGISGAGQIDGLQSNSGPALPVGLENYVNPGGVGDALVYNYYNARSNMVTYFTVVNTHKVVGSRVRLRFYEAANVKGAEPRCPTESRGSNEVLDFDICLSKGDMWSGYIQKNPVSGAAQLCSLDTDTNIVSSDTAPAKPFPAACVDFKFGTNNTVRQITADQTLEGYFVIIGENQLSHVVSGGTCGSKLFDNTLTDVQNVLTGNVQMIGDTGSFTYNATAIADFGNTGLSGAIASKFPELKDGTNSLPGINYILSKSELISVYDVQGTNQTDYVLTAPTKKFSQVCGPTNDMFDNSVVKFTTWSDDEQSPTGTCDFSPCPPGSQNRLPYEVNVISMNGSNLLDSTVDQNVVSPFTFGWFNINLGQTSHRTIFNGVRTSGWPILGLTFTDDGAFPMQYKTTVTPLVTPL